MANLFVCPSNHFEQGNWRLSDAEDEVCGCGVPMMRVQQGDVLEIVPPPGLLEWLLSRDETTPVDKADTQPLALEEVRNVANE